jgi:signal transduction histidine kinase
MAHNFLASPAMSSRRSPVRLFVSADLWRAAALLVSNFVAGTVWFAVLTTLLALGLFEGVILIGVPILVGTMLLWRAGAQYERRRVAALAGMPLAPPYRPLPEAGVWRRLLARASDPATWRDLLYLLLLFPLGLVELLILVLALAVPVGLLAASLSYLLGIPAWWVYVGLAGGTPAEAVLGAGIGLAWLIAGEYLVVGAARLHAALALDLLGETAARRIAALEASRRRIFATTELERRRIERDLHDGVQQRLVALALDLGMAREKLATQPEQAQALLDAALEQAKRAMAELRDVVRGIHPAILTERGLDAALSVVAANCPVPVDLRVETGGRLPEVVEAAAYYLVAEALTNVAKHSRATAASVVVHRAGNRLLVEIEDDGVGGADAGGPGLAGLAERFAALGGRLEVASPSDGPTRIHGELPCA